MCCRELYLYSQAHCCKCRSKPYSSFLFQASLRFSTMHFSQTAALLTLSVLPPIVSSQSLDGSDYCEAAGAAIEICDSSTPDFQNLDASEQASCLCGSSIGTIAWGPSTFDRLIDRCYSYEITASPELASTMSVLQGFCASNYATETTSLYVSSTRTSRFQTATQVISSESRIQVYS